MTTVIIQPSDANYRQAITQVRDRLRGSLVSADEGKLDVSAIVRSIVADVAARGDGALVELTAKFDGVRFLPSQLRVPQAAIDAAHRAAEPAFLALVRRVANNIRQYQKHILVQAPPALERGSRRLGVRYTPIRRAGVYVPGGKALYPSTVLMTVVPAQVAGVSEVAVVSPPTTNGDVNPMVLALAGELGITEVYRVGGAQAIAALAMGTTSIRAVDKIVGPGNAFVAEAKRQLFGRVGIDSIAGPSEVLIVADDAARPDWLAADMLAQAEHNPGSAVLVTTSPALAQAVAGQVAIQVANLERKEAIVSALEQYSAIIVAQSLQQACDIANDFATEHLQIVTRDDDATLGLIRNAGAVFVGQHTPVPLGDYYAGPSHVLPTGGTARFFSPLSVNDFMKSSSVIRYNAAALAQDAADVIDFATREGLTAHANAVRVRIKTTT